MKISDELRDDILPYLGIRLEDKSGQPSIWKLEDPETLIKERERKIEEKKQKEEEKKQRAELALKKKSTPASEWFKVFFADKYSKFDEQGLPTHNSKDKELHENERKKLQKEWNKQDGIYKKWVEEEEKKQQQ